MKQYWYYIILACIVAALSPQIDKAMKRLIPDDLKRAKAYQVFLFSMTAVYAVAILFITYDTLPLPVSLFLSLFPLVCAIIGTLISFFRSRR